MPKKWRLVEMETRNAYENMALDEIIMNEVREERSLPTVRFYRWNPSAVSIGIQQEIEKNVNIDACREYDIDYIRRITGGGTVYHSYEGEITYSVIAPKNFFPKGLKQRFRLICGWIIDSLENLGLQAEFEPINDVTVHGKKISGSAQTIRKGTLLQHGTILYNMDLERMFSVIQVGEEKLADKQIKDPSERVTSVKNHKNVSREDLYNALKQGFLKDKTYEVKDLKKDEIKKAENLATEKYSTDEWIFKR